MFQFFFVFMDMYAVYMYLFSEETRGVTGKNDGCSVAGS